MAVSSVSSFLEVYMEPWESAFLTGINLLFVALKICDIPLESKAGREHVD